MKNILRNLLTGIAFSLLASTGASAQLLDGDGTSTLSGCAIPDDGVIASIIESSFATFALTNEDLGTVQSGNELLVTFDLELSAPLNVAPECFGQFLVDIALPVLNFDSGVLSLVNAPANELSIPLEDIAIGPDNTGPLVIESSLTVLVGDITNIDYFVQSVTIGAELLGFDAPTVNDTGIDIGGF